MAVSVIVCSMGYNTSPETASPDAVRWMTRFPILLQVKRCPGSLLPHIWSWSTRESEQQTVTASGVCEFWTWSNRSRNSAAWSAFPASKSRNNWLMRGQIAAMK